MQHDANVTNQIKIAAVNACSLSTPKTKVSTRNVAACAPPPTAGTCTAEPTAVNASTSIAPVKLSDSSSPPKARAVHM